MYNYAPFRRTLNVTGLEFPLALNDVPKFEILKPEISVNVLGLNENEAVIPLYVSKLRDRPHHVNLLLLTKEIEVDDRPRTIYHYTLVKSLSSLLRSSTYMPAAYCTACTAYIVSTIRSA